MLDALNAALEKFMDAVETRITSMEARIKALPTPEKGDKGDPGNSIKGDPGNDGKSITIDEVLPHLLAEQAKMALDNERRIQDTVQRMFDAWPKPKDGIPSMDQMKEMVFAGIAEALPSFVPKAVEDHYATLPPMPEYKGVFKRGESYTRANLATWDGNLWHCNEETSDVPGTSGAWQLAVRKGKDGKRPQ